MIDAYPEPQDTALFEPLKARAESHWRKFQPKYVRMLEKTNKLDEALTQATCRAIRIMQEAMDQGCSLDQAEEVALPEILLPPELKKKHRH